MKILSLLIFCVSATLSGYSQYDSANLPRKDSVQLSKFWIDLSKSVADNDLAAIKNLCNFPFICTQCVDSTDSAKDYIKVTSVNFDKRRYKVFLGFQFRQTLNKYRMPTDLFIFHPTYNKHGKQDGYVFSYII